MPVDLNHNAPMVKRFIAVTDSVPYGWTVVYDGDDYKVIAIAERRTESREMVAA